MSRNKTDPNGATSEQPDDAPDPYQLQRSRMVDVQIAARGIDDELVVAAMRKVPRQKFVTADLASFAHGDGALPIACGQTISQPYIVALMTDMLDLDEDSRVLEIGTGSGYQAAVLSRIVRQVYSIERIDALARAARERLARLGYRNVETRCGDGYRGWPEEAPYDGIVVTAAAPCIPPALTEQLKPGGRMVIPVGLPQMHQELILVTRDEAGETRTTDLIAVAFVPMVEAADDGG